ncbi:MAG: MotA/TolQ/ExbB proton channel family protein [Kiritimatiellae bacterium]|nr:MotA/TolQ/ExbB proton channel family protein [Kiritimatiellia bacterium]
MLGILMDGGWMMVPLLFCSILGLAVIIDRMRAFKAAGSDHENLRKSIRQKLDEGDVNTAIELASNATGPVAATILNGLNRFVRLVGKDRQVDVAANAAVKSMEEYAPKAMRPLEMRLNILVLVASIAPLLGMTGTVTGMITSFDVMASAAGLDPGAVAGGIGEALITTAAGLLVAMPCVVFYNVFTRKIDDLSATIDTALADIMETLGES